jgi:hypothetical protein
LPQKTQINTEKNLWQSVLSVAKKYPRKIQGHLFIITHKILQ